MQKLSLAFIAALSLAVFGCSKKGGDGDCASTVGGVIDRAMASQMGESKDMPAEAKKAAEAMMKTMVPKMKAAMTKACTDDKWSAEALACMSAAKDKASMEKCQGTLTPEQQANVEKAVGAAMGMPAGD